ncbi:MULTISPECIES: hypothetical protein [Fischerella]|uniref:hypothetical protein n=1 Tax=Fischerella TaxID=1190 RepID=UPI00138AE85A|nr:MULTISPECIES: hypothetical protein [Fischerella]
MTPSQIIRRNVSNGGLDVGEHASSAPLMRVLNSIGNLSLFFIRKSLLRGDFVAYLTQKDINNETYCYIF